jgi:hypothetical protein
MKKILIISILVVLITLGVGGWYLAQDVIRSFHVAGEGFKTAAGALIASSAVPSQDDKPSAKLMPYDMRPINACIEDEDCYFYMFSVHLSHPADTVIYDRPNVPEAKPGHWTEANFDIEGRTVQKRLRVVNALTPSQCIRDRECAWYAFYNIVARNYGGGQDDNILIRWEGEIEYYVLPDEVPGSYGEEVDQIFSRIRPIFPYKIFEGKGASFLFFFSGNFERDVLGRYRKFFSRVYNNIVFDYIHQSQIEADDMKQASLVYHDLQKGNISWVLNLVSTKEKIWQHHLADALHGGLGLNSPLKSFPFSVTNIVTDKSEASVITTLDLFLIALLYHSAFEAGMKTDEVTLRPAFDKAYDIVNKDFFKKIASVEAGKGN